MKNSILIAIIALVIGFAYAYKHPENTFQVFWGMIVGSLVSIAVTNIIEETKLNNHA